MAITIRSVNVVLLKRKFTYFLNVLPPIHHAKCWSQMFLRFLLNKIYFPALNLLP